MDHRSTSALAHRAQALRGAVGLWGGAGCLCWWERAQLSNPPSQRNPCWREVAARFLSTPRGCEESPQLVMMFRGIGCLQVAPSRATRHRASCRFFCYSNSAACCVSATACPVDEEERMEEAERASSHLFSGSGGRGVGCSSQSVRWAAGSWPGLSLGSRGLSFIACQVPSKQGNILFTLSCSFFPWLKIFKWLLVLKCFIFSVFIFFPHYARKKNSSA